MASGWIGNGPVSLPPRSLAYGVGFALILLAAAGVGLGLRASWREAGAPELGGGEAGDAAGSDTLTAKPIVELPPPVAAADNSASNADADAVEDAKADALAAKTEAAQAVQAKPSKTGADIDDILTSTSEKPPAPAKPATDEAPPSAPVKSDVPF
jgi:hypothetical protein